MRRWRGRALVSCFRFAACQYIRCHFLIITAIVAVCCWITHGIVEMYYPTKANPMSMSKNIVIPNASNNICCLSVESRYGDWFAHGSALNIWKQVLASRIFWCWIYGANHVICEQNIETGNDMQGGCFADVFIPNSKNPGIMLGIRKIALWRINTYPCSLFKRGLLAGIIQLTSSKEGERNRSDKEYNLQNILPPFEAMLLVVPGAIGCFVIWMRAVNNGTSGGNWSVVVFFICFALQIISWAIFTNWL